MKYFVIGLLLGLTISATSGHSYTQRMFTVQKGDTLRARFSVQTDTVLKVSGYNIIANKCGKSHIYLRLWQNRIATHDSLAILGDSSLINVVCSDSLTQLQIDSAYIANSHVEIALAVKTIDDFTQLLILDTIHLKRASDQDTTVMPQSFQFYTYVIPNMFHITKVVAKLDSLGNPIIPFGFVQ